MNYPFDITNEDCMELMARFPDDHFDLAIVDPPYGQNALDGSFTEKKYGIDRRDNWDCYRPTTEYFRELLRVSKNQVIWGGNYFLSDLVDTKCMIIWDKKQSEKLTNYAMCEVAWTSLDKPAKIFRSTANQKDRIHPTQKPVELYEFVLHHFAEEGMEVLDTHLGSGSIALACHNYNMKLTACEIDPDMFRKSVERINLHRQQISIQQQINETDGNTIRQLQIDISD